MSEQTTLTQEELDFLKQTKEESQNIVFALGQIQVERIGLTMRLTELEKVQQDAENQFKAIVAKEQEFSKKLFEKYGDAIIDIESGTIKKNS